MRTRGDYSSATGVTRVNPAPAERWTLASLSFPMLLSSVGTSSANVALPTLVKAFGASFQAVQWVVLAYLLAVTAMIVSVGRLGDMMGKRRLMLGGLMLFATASACCGVAPSLGWLVAARAVQGLGGAIMMALSLALVSESVPKARVGGAMGLLGTMSAIGTALGPSVGGILVASVGWRAIFLANVPLGLLACFMVWRHLPAEQVARAEASGRFDVTGTVVLVATLVAYSLAMTLGRGHFTATNVVLFAAASVGVCAFLAVESNAPSPLLRIAMFRDAALRGGLGMSTLVSTVMMATLVVGPFYLSGALSLDAARVGLVLSTGPVVTALTGVPAGQLTDRFGAERVTMLGLVGLSIGLVLLATLPTSLGAAGYVISIICVTIGYALFQTANNTAVMTNVSPLQRGVVSALLSLSRNLGLITGASALGALFAFASAGVEATLPRPEAVAHGMRMTFAASALLVLLAIAIGRTSRLSSPLPAGES